MITVVKKIWHSIVKARCICCLEEIPKNTIYLQVDFGALPPLKIHMHCAYELSGKLEIAIATKAQEKRQSGDLSDYTLPETSLNPSELEC